MSIYIFVSTSSDYHVFSKNIPAAKEFGIKVCAFYLSQFDSIKKELSAGDILVTRNLGGLSFNKESLEKMNQIAHAKNLPFICLPGYKNDDPSILSLSTAPVPVCQKMFSYYEACHSGHIIESLKYLSDLYCGTSLGWQEPEPFNEFGFLPEYLDQEYIKRAKKDNKKIIAVLLYRTHYLADS